MKLAIEVVPNASSDLDDGCRRRPVVQGANRRLARTGQQKEPPSQRFQEGGLDLTTNIKYVVETIDLAVVLVWAVDQPGVHWAQPW